MSKGHPEFFHGELWFAADSNNVKRLMGGSMFCHLKKDIMRSVAYVSVDGGQSWESPFVTGESTDPACAYGIDGTAYWLHLNREEGGQMEIIRSKAGDDPSTRDMVFFHSDNGGTRFSDVVAGPAPAKQFANPGNAVVLYDGTFGAVFADLRKGSESIALVTSSDGEHLSPPTKISDWHYPLSESGRLLYMPVIAAFRDRLYVVWTDNRSGRAAIYFSWSSDRGRTWPTPKAVNDGGLETTFIRLLP